MDEAVISMRFGDLVALIIYFCITLGIGFWCSTRLKSTESYFVGGRRVPGWAVGISMLGTAISSVTFLAYPGNAFDKDWRMLVPGLMIPIAAFLAVYVFVPFFRRARLVSVYQYLELRFGVWARVYGCIMWSIHSFFRMGVILFLLSLPVQTVTGYDQYTIIIVLGILVTIYTVVGGIEAVIWTDVLQTIVLIMGGIFCIATVFMDLPGGASTVFADGWASQKFNLSFNFDFTLMEETLLVLILYGLFQNLQEFVSDQTKVQRYCAASTDRGAQRATWLGGVGCIPVWIVFMFVGTCLWVYYNHFPNPAVTEMAIDKPDQVFPFFILHRLPVGIAGFVIAAVMAAAMSSIDSSMNGVATVLTTDIYHRLFVKGRDDRFYLNVARWITALAGLFMIFWALALTRIESSILPVAFAIYAVLAGGLGGLYFIGMFTRRANSQGALVGIILAIIVTIWMTLSNLGQMPDSIASHFHRLMTNVATNIVSFVIGYLASFAFPKPAMEKLENLTIWTFQHKEETSN